MCMCVCVFSPTLTLKQILIIKHDYDINQKQVFSIAQKPV